MQKHYRALWSRFSRDIVFVALLQETGGIMKGNIDGYYPAFDRGVSAAVRAKEQPRDDLSLCFLCLRWSTGDEVCRNGARCEMQVKLDLLDKRLETAS
jgi:hypothetical protein